jgi:hypothetical protein
MKINSEENKINNNLFGENKEDNDIKQSIKTNKSIYEDDEKSSKYKVKSISQKIDIYPNNYYKITEEKKKFNNTNNNYFDNDFSEELLLFNFFICSK